jgi:tetratricopeptide (TPR) repeat protein
MRFQCGLTANAQFTGPSSAERNDTKMAPSRRQHLPKPTRRQLNDQWRQEGLDLDQRAHRFRQPTSAGGVGARGLESYRLANDLSQTDVAIKYTAQHGGGVTASIVSRWEAWPDGHKPIQPGLLVVRRLAAIYQTNAANLVAAIFHPDQPGHFSQLPTPGRVLAHVDGTDATWISATLAAPAAPLNLDSDQRDGLDGDTALRRPEAAVEAFGDDDLWQLARAMKASSIDAAMLDQMELSVLRTHRVYASLAPGELFPAVQARLRTVAELLAQPQPIAVRGRLCVLAGHLAGLRAWLMFDLGDHQGALAVYDRALEPATEAGEDALCGWLLGGKSLIPSYAGDPKAALAMIQHGQRHAARTGDRTCHAWLAALEARAHAGLRNAAGYRAAQERANQAADETRVEERRHGMDFHGDTLSLSYYQGTSLAALGEAAAAQPVLEQALQVQGPGHLKARSIVLLALASTYVQQQQIEEACRLAAKALAIPPPQQRIGPIAQRAADLRRQLAPWHATPAVKAFDAQLAALQPLGEAR